MTMAGYSWGSVPEGLRRLAESMFGQESVGIGGSLLHRLFRYLGGDPSASFGVTSTGTGDVHGLPDNTPAESASFVVQGNAIAYTLDGSVPNAALSAVIPVGSTVLLTGQPTLKAFRFVSTSFSGSSVNGNYFS